MSIRETIQNKKTEMKKNLLFALTVLCVNAVFGQSQPRVAVYVTGDAETGDRRVVAAALVSEIVHSDEYMAVERTAEFLVELGREHDYQQSGEVDVNRIIEVGRKMEANFVCVAEVSRVRESVFVSVRMIRVISGQIVATAAGHLEINRTADLDALATHVTQNLMRSLAGERPVEQKVPVPQPTAPPQTTQVQDVIHLPYTTQPQPIAPPQVVQPEAQPQPTTEPQAMQSLPAPLPVLTQFHELKRDKSNGKWGFVDVHSGKVVIPHKYDGAKDFSEGLAAIKLNRRWGFIDETDKEFIPIMYKNVRSFKKGLAAISLNGWWGYIDISGMVVIPIVHEFVPDAKPDVVRVLGTRQGL